MPSEGNSRQKQILSVSPALGAKLKKEDGSHIASLNSVALTPWPVLREGRGGHVLCAVILRTQKKFPLLSFDIASILHSSE